MRRPLLTILSMLVSASLANAQTLSSFVSKFSAGDTLTATAFASGDVRGLATGETDDSESANGALGLSVSSNHVASVGAINVASTLQTIDKDFAAVLLSPSNGKALRSGLAEVRLQQLFGKQGLHAYGCVSSSEWVQEEASLNATVVGAGALIYRQLGLEDDSRNKVQFGLEGGIAIRSILGDAASSDSLREVFLGSDRTNFVGLELGMNILVNRVSAGVQFYFFPGRDVEGVTGGQVTTGISIRGDLFSLRGGRQDNGFSPPSKAEAAAEAKAAEAKAAEAKAKADVKAAEAKAKADAKAAEAKAKADAKAKANSDSKNGQ